MIFLATDGLVKSAQKISNSYGGFSSFYTLSGNNDYFGGSVSSIGDMNGDGVSDMVFFLPPSPFTPSLLHGQPHFPVISLISHISPLVSRW